MRIAVLLSVWVLGCVVTLFIAAFFLVYTDQIRAIQPFAPVLAERDEAIAFAALPEPAGDVLGAVSVGDARPIIVRTFLEKYGAPLSSNAEYLVRAADHYGLPDFRILPAIAMQESNGCKVIPFYSNNCWGYGIYADQTMRFATMEEAIDRVARGLREDYYDQGLTTPYQIMTKYTPPSVAKGGPWASAVEEFMREME